MITWADVVAHAPELASIDVVAQTNILAYVNAAFNEASLASASAQRAKLVRIYFAAHIATVESRGAGGASGAVISETRGRLSRTYGAAPAGVFASTSYGQAYLALVRTSISRAPFVL